MTAALDGLADRLFAEGVAGAEERAAHGVTEHGGAHLRYSAQHGGDDPMSTLENIAPSALPLPSVERAGVLRVFGFVVPACMYLLFFATAQWIGGLWWSVHVWTGVAFLAGLTGLQLTCLVITPGRDRREGQRPIISSEGIQRYGG